MFCECLSSKLKRASKVVINFIESAVHFPSRLCIIILKSFLFFSRSRS